MPNYPTLSVNPELPIDEEREDSTIKSDFDGGYQLTRPRFTRIRRKFKVIYKHLPAADKDTLDSFVTTVKGGADSFVWTHPVSQSQYTMRFEKPPKYSYVSYNYYDVEFILIEV